MTSAPGTSRRHCWPAGPPGAGHLRRTRQYRLDRPDRAGKLCVLPSRLCAGSAGPPPHTDGTKASPTAPSTADRGSAGRRGRMCHSPRRFRYSCPSGSPALRGGPGGMASAVLPTPSARTPRRAASRSAPASGESSAASSARRLVNPGTSSGSCAGARRSAAGADPGCGGRVRAATSRRRTVGRGEDWTNDAVSRGSARVSRDRGQKTTQPHHGQLAAGSGPAAAAVPAPLISASVAITTDTAKRRRAVTGHLQSCSPCCAR